MAATSSGSLYFGPVADDARYYSVTDSVLPDADWSMGWIVRLDHMRVGPDPSAPIGAYSFLWGNTSGAGTGGNDCYLRLFPDNFSSTGSRRKLAARIVRGGSGNTLTGTTQFDLHDTIVIVVQRNGTDIQLYTCLADGSAVLEASATAATGSKSLGTQNFGLGNNANYIQAAWRGSKALSTGEIEAIAAGGDIEDAYTAGQRLNAWLFDQADATISAHWGANNATRNGDWSAQPLASPVLQNASSQISLDDLTPYQPIALPYGEQVTSFEFSGGYEGFSPDTFEYQLLDATDNSTLVDWTSFSSFSASAGSWSGTASLPAGYLRINVRDAVSTSIVYRSGNAFCACPVIMTIGQSPMVYAESSYPGLSPGDGLVVTTAGTSGELFAVSDTFPSAGMEAMSAALGDLSASPVCWLPAAITGTSSSQWASKDASVWPQMLAQIANAGTPANIVFYFLNGAADINLSAATIQGNHDTIIDNLDDDVTTSLGVTYQYVMIPHQRQGQSLAANNQTVRAAQREWAEDHADNGTKVFLGPAWQDCQMDNENTGTAQAGTSTTITLAADTAEVVENAMTGITVEIIGGTGGGQTRTTSGYDTSTKVLTVSSSWSVTPDNTSVYYTYGSAATHQNDQYGTRELGYRMAYDVAYRFGYSDNDGQGPLLVSCTYPNGGDGQIIDARFSITNGSQLQTRNGNSSNVYGFEVSTDSGSNYTAIDAAEIISSNTVRITLDSAPSDPADLRVRHLYGYPVAQADFNRLGDLVTDDSGVGDVGGLLAWFSLSALSVTEALPASGSAERRGLGIRGFGLGI